MKVLVDTCIWSLSLRRQAGGHDAPETAWRDELASLLEDDRILMVGPVRQELLSGVREPTMFQRLRERLRAFPDELLVADDFELAAEASNQCRAAGIAGSAVDLLLCAVAMRRSVSIFTVDRDFDRYAEVLPIQLHRSSCRGA